MNTNLKQITSRVRMGLKLTGLALLTSLLINCASTRPVNSEEQPVKSKEQLTDMYAETGGTWGYKHAVINASGLEVQKPKVEHETEGNISWMTTNYADGTVTQTRFVYGPNDAVRVSSKTDVSFGTDYQGLCEEPFNLEVVGSGYLIDNPGWYKLIDAAGKEADLITLQEESDSTSQDGNITTRVRRQVYHGVVTGGFSGFSTDFLDNICRQVDTDGNMIPTSYELDRHAEKQAKELFSMRHQ